MPRNSETVVVPVEPLSDETLVRIGVELTAYCRTHSDRTAAEAAVAFDHIIEVLAGRRRK